MGELRGGSKHLEKAFRLYDIKRHQPLTFRYAGLDGGVHSLTVAAIILWYLGYPDQALTKVNQGLALAQGLAHPHSLVFAEYMVSTMYQIRRDVRAARQGAEKVIALSAEHGFPDYLAFMTIQRGWAMVEQERHEEGIAQIQEGLATARARGAELIRPYFLCLLAEACSKTNRLDEGLGVLEEALAEVDVHENRMYEPEIYCLKGELLLKKHESNASEAQTCFQRAIEVARKQSAKSLELRATTSLARLLDQQGRHDEALALIAEIYNWFTEGFDTADLKEAKSLLEELSI
jgi:adenylate cyclase